VPRDARVLDGDSLVVYPGLVDADGSADHEFPVEEFDRSEVELWDAPRPIQGFMPARLLSQHLKADGEAVASQRKAGIVAAAVHPGNAMMPGRGAVLLYRADAEAPAALVVEPALGPKFAFRGGRGVYPGTLFGVTAFIRQAFDDARYQARLAAAYSSDPRGVTMPRHDADYDVLRQVLDGALPVYFEADEAVDILRVVSLADEYGFRPVIVGGQDAWQVADELARRDIPVLVSTDFGTPRRWDPEDASGEPLDAAAEREKDRFEDRYANAARLAEAGVTFALTSGGTGEMLEGVRKSVEYGLPAGAALAAVTSTPARLLGISSVPRVEEGLPATFLVASGPLFDEETTVAYTFVEGILEEGAEPGAAAGDPDAAVDFAGVWDMTLDMGGQNMSALLRVEQDGATFEGSMEVEGMTLQVRDGVINGNVINATAIMTQGGQTIEIDIDGTVEGDTASGEADAGPMGVSRWTARRTGPGGTR
ncbi:MAG TPA: amidohydrolase family protein, partial [Longimicrobiales bacterium]|nr:amidohydrolase family protein [Longimicrobiales bacterium]